MCCAPIPGWCIATSEWGRRVTVPCTSLPAPLLRRRGHAFDRHQRRRYVVGLVGPLAEVGDDAALAFRPSRLADMAPVQDQPVMRMAQIFQRNDLQKPLLYLVRGFAGRQHEPITEPQDVR